MGSPLEIVAVPAFADNYLWLIHDADSDETAVVDPGDPEPVLAEADRRGWRITTILNTHWHPDHTGGNLTIKETSGATIIGPSGENGRVPGVDRAIGEGDRISIGAHEAEVWEVPGHTIGHIRLIFRRRSGSVRRRHNVRDGCGRLFEGSAAKCTIPLGPTCQMPDDTKLYCAHDITLANARFAAHAFPGNKAIATGLRTSLKPATRVSARCPPR